MGLSRRARTFTTPPFSPIFMMPSQSDKTPVSPKEISNAVFDDENVESIMAGKTSKSPRNTSFTSAMTKAMMKNATHIQFSTILRAKLHIIFELRNRNCRESVHAYAIFAGRLPNTCWKANEKVLESLLKNWGIFGMPHITPRVFCDTSRVFCDSPGVFLNKTGLFTDNSNV